jgi:molybdopterin/thiamine biosynthesis adenylyltransferase
MDYKMTAMNLSKFKILAVGVGGLGCPASLALAEAGVGTFGFMDPEKVELSNRHRQILYSDKDVGRMKVGATTEYLQKNFPKTKMESGIVPISLLFGARADR